MKSDTRRIQRLLAILTLLQGSAGWTVRRLADHFGVAERTVFRDLTDLEKAGVPVLRSDGSGYSISKEFFLPPVQLTLDEAMAMAVLAGKIAEDDQIPLTLPASKAMAKIRSHFPASLRGEFEPVEKRLSVKLGAMAIGDGMDDVYRTVQSAIGKKRVLRCEYDSVHGSGKSRKEFQLRSYALMFNTRSWYVVGHHSGHDHVRVLKLNRFTLCQSTAIAYAIPAEFNIDKHLGNAWRMIRGKPAYAVRLKFDAEFAETISDTQWHHTQVITPNHDDDTCIYECKVDGLDEIVWWILSMGPHCVVQSPKALQDRVAELAARTAAIYGTQS